MRSRKGSRQRRTYYYCCCSSYHHRGTTVCTNALEISLADADAAVLSAFEDQLLEPTIISEAIRRAIDATKQPEKAIAAQRTRLEKTVRTLDAELVRLGDAVASGGAEMATVLAAIKERERRRREAQEALTALLQPAPSRLTMQEAEARIMARLKDWRGLLRDHAPKARQILRRLIDGRVTFYPDPKRRMYRFETTGSLVRRFEGFVDVQLRWRPHREPIAGGHAPCAAA